MPTRTLLSMVQSILSDMDSDEVNSISDTVESDQVANVVRDKYYDLVEEFELPTDNTLFNLEGLADSTKPNYMKIPDIVRSIEWIKYNNKSATDTAPDYRDIVYLSPKNFIDRVLTRNLDDTEVISVSGFSGEELLIRNDKAPEWYTSFDDTYIVFDSYDAAADSTMQASKSSCYGSDEATFTLSDTFIPNLPNKFFPILLSEAKAKCFVLYKQVTNQAEQRTGRKLRVKWQRNKDRERGNEHEYFAQGR